MTKDVSKIKRISLSKGFIGKSVPCTPTLLGWAILNQHYSKSVDIGRRVKPQNRLLLVNEVERELIAEV
jgi:hypothetical protein